MSRRFDISSIKNTYSPEEREEEESKTSHWGGEVYGEKVGSLDEAAVKRADGILEAARSYLVKRFGDPDLDAESVPDIEVMLAQLTREKGGAEKFSAHQRAQYYLGIKYLEAQIMDPKSDMAEQENLYDGDVLTRKGERLLEEIGKSREEIFFNLTGFKESRKRDTLWGKVKRLDGWLREKSLEAYREVKAKGKKARWQAKAWNFVGGMARRPLNNAVALGALGLTAGVMGGLDMGAMGRLAGEAGVGVAGLVGAQKVGRSEKPGESVLNTLVRRVAGKRILGHEIGGKEGTMSDERFYEEFKDLFSAEKAVKELEEQELVDVVRRDLLSSARLTSQEKQQINQASSVEEMMTVLSSGEKGKAEKRREEFTPRFYRRVVAMAFEKMAAEELDEMAREVALDKARAELPESKESLEELKGRVSEQIKGVLEGLGKMGKGRLTSEQQARKKELEEQLYRLRIKEVAIKDALRFIEDPKGVQESVLDARKGQSIEGLAESLSFSDEQVYSILSRKFNLKDRRTIDKRLALMGPLAYLNFVADLLQASLEQEVK